MSKTKSQKNYQEFVKTITVYRYQEKEDIQVNTVVNEVDLIEFEPDGENEVIYEYIEVEEPQQEAENHQIKTTETFCVKKEVDELVRTNNHEEKFTCSNRVCKRSNISFDSKQELDLHNEIHFEQFKNSQCPICNKILANQVKLNVHLELRHTPKFFTCDQCAKVFRSKDNLRLHMSHHRKYFYVECRACKRGYKSIQSLRYHLRQHFEHHQCETCGKVFEHKKLLLGHVAAIHNQELQVQCHFCTRMFSRSDVRDAHERDIHKNGSVGSYFKCNECDSAFDLRDELMSHKILNHFSGIIHTCEECGKNFKKKSLLDLHMNVHRKKTISCDVCKQLFTFITGLNKHKKLGRCKGPPADSLKDRLTKEEIAKIAKEQLMEITVNPKKDEDIKIETVESESINQSQVVVKKKPGRKPKFIPKESVKQSENVSESEIDESPAITIRTLTDNEIKQQQVITSSSGRVIKPKLPMVLSQSYRPANIHKKINVPFNCDLCGLSLDSKLSLLAHLNNHIRNKKHKCTECDESFCNITNLKRHWSKSHQSENPFKEKKFVCDICDKRYLTKHLLGMHKKSHENLREFKCTHGDCCFETNSPYDLNNHVKRVHNPTRVHKCTDCDKLFKRRCDMINHRSAVHSDVRCYVKCPVCTTIVLEKGLQSHIINRHSEKAQVKPFECDICGKRERYEKALQRHYFAVHEPKNRGVVYQCPECEATFYRRRDATAHSFDHYKGDIYECQSCHNKYKSRKELTNHEYSHRPTTFPCHVCKQVFQTKSGRSKHLRKHKDVEFDAMDNTDNEIAYEGYEVLEEVEIYENNN